MTTLKIQVGGLSEGIHRYHFTVSPIELALDEFEGVIAIEAVLDRSPNQLRVSGSIKATGKFSCDRCVSPFSKSLSSSYTMVYVSEGMDTNYLDSAEIQVMPAGLNVIDISEDVRQTILLSVPLKLLCAESCKGLCPICGKNMNAAQCDCSETIVDSRWEGLRKIQSN